MRLGEKEGADLLIATDPDADPFRRSRSFAKWL